MRYSYVVLCGLLLFVMLVITGGHASAGVTGKISGRVTDRVTGAPLPFADVTIVESTMRALTDQEGYYYILNVPPGTYEVEARLTGYTPLSQSGVLAVTDQTTRVDFCLARHIAEQRQEMAEGRTIVGSNTIVSKTTLARETMSGLPVDTFEEAFLAASGVVRDPPTREMHVRGGRSGDVLYLVDGIPIKDDLIGGAAGLEISTHALEEMTYTLGGYSAEYGGAQSSVVNLVTREGNEHRHSGRLAYKTDDLGLDKYSFNTDRVEFILSGPEPITSYLLPLIGLKLPGRLTYFVSADGEWTDTYTPFQNLHFPRYETFFGRISLRDRQDNKNNLNTKLIYRLSPTKKLTYGYHQSYRFYLPSDYDLANAFRYLPENTRHYWKQSDLRTASWSHTFSENTFYELSVSRFVIDTRFQTGNYSLYDLNEYPETSDNPLDDISHRIDGMEEPYIDVPHYDGEIGNPDTPREVYLDLNGNGIYDPGEPFFDEAVSNGHYDVGEQFRDFNGDGIWSGNEPDSTYDSNSGEYSWWSAYDPNTDYNMNGVQDSLVHDGFYDYGYDKWCLWHRSRQEQWTGKFDLTSQVTREHQLKTGVEMRLYEVRSGTIPYGYMANEESELVPEGEPYPERGILRDFWLRTPIAGGVYLQDNIETGSMIVNAGLRWEFWYPGSQEYYYFDRDAGEPAWQGRINPRLGSALLISERDKLYFAYGIYSQFPEFEYIASKLYGNPDLKPEQTSIYELGVIHAFTNNLFLELSGFYKDVRDPVSCKLMGEPPSTRDDCVNLVGNTARGVEVKLSKRYSTYTAGSISYTYQRAMLKSSGDSDYDPEGHPLPLSESPMDWDQHHSIAANVELRVPEGQSPHLLGLTLPDRMGLSVLWQYGSGLPWTADAVIRKPHETANARRLPSINTLDLKAWKRFNLGPLTYGVELEVLNVTDKTNVLAVHDDTGLPGEGYGELPTHLGNPIFDEEGISRDKPHYYGPRRQILAGISVSF
jgi:outer membrane receptor protein involved in Fe transport